MSDTLLTILIILAIAIAIGLIAVMVLLVRFNNKPAPTQSREEIESFGIIKAKLDNLDSKINDSIETSLNKEMLKLSEKMSKNSEDNNAKLERFQNNINEGINKRFDGLNKQIDDKLLLMNKKVDDRLAEGFKSTTETMSQVRERLQAIDVAQKNIEGLGKEVISLKNVLEGNQSRGQYGEYQLEMVLHNVFGDTIGCYETQYTMKKVKDGDDVRADAVVFMPEPNKMIAIDSKFPFADYSKIFDSQDEEEKERLKKEFGAAVKKHITAIKDKYIVEGKTAPEAIMFIPNDGVFAFVHHELTDVVEYAREKKVVLTSPSTLPPILLTINMVKIETKRAEQAHEITKQLEKLGKDFEMFAREWVDFSNQISKIGTRREQLDKRVGKITNKFDSLKGADQIEIENEQIPFIDDEES